MLQLAQELGAETAVLTGDRVAFFGPVVSPAPTGDGGLTGDVDAEAVSARAGALTPVPGGVGPVTTALLLRHTARAANLP